MREIRFGRGATDLEMRRFVAHRFEGPSRFADSPFLCLEMTTQPLGRFVRHPHLLAEVFERAQIVVEPTLGRSDALVQLLAAGDLPPQLLPARDHGPLERAP